MDFDTAFFYITLFGMKGPIGIFDSGYGGLTVLKAIKEKLPQYDYLYLGDNARTPYGTRSFEAVYQYSLESVKYLFDQGCHLVIFACNTASAKALRSIQQLDLPHLAPEKRVLGVIRPTTELIGKMSSGKVIGVLGTTGTIQSNSYQIEIQRFFPEAAVFQQDCPMWVPLVENNELSNEGASYFIKKSIDELLARSSRIDTILLACTHYPLLLDLIEKHVPEGIKIVTQGEIVANSLKDYLQRHTEIAVKCNENSGLIFQTTDSVEKFNAMSALFLKEHVSAEKVTY